MDMPYRVQEDQYRISSTLVLRLQCDISGTLISVCSPGNEQSLSQVRLYQVCSLVSASLKSEQTHSTDKGLKIGIRRSRVWNEDMLLLVHQCFASARTELSEVLLSFCWHNGALLWSEQKVQMTEICGDGPDISSARAVAIKMEKAGNWRQDSDEK